MEGQDGQSTANLLNKEIGFEITADEAITIEHLLFEKLTAEKKRLQEELAAEKAGHVLEGPLTDEPMDRQIMLLNRQVINLSEENRQIETNRNFMRDQINRAVLKLAPNCLPMTLEAAVDRILFLCEEAGRGCVERGVKIGELNREIELLLGFNDRLLSLVRYARQELHEQDAISDKEYAALVEQPGYREALETHDSLRTQLEAAQARIRELEESK
jgi:hypothetical protein